MAYRSHNRERVESWCDRVLDGSEVSSHWIQLAVRRYRRDICKYRFSQVKADLACDFFPAALRHTKGQFAGQPFELTDLQLFIVWNLFGFQDMDKDRRRFQRCLITVSRKWGKTTLAAGIALVMMYLDGEEEGEYYVAATTEAQASITHTQAVRFVQVNPELGEFADIYKQGTRFRALVLNKGPYHNNIFRCVASDSSNLDGLNPAGFFVDELHAWSVTRHSGLRERLQTGGGARLQPIELIISTNGDENSTFYHQEVLAAKDTLEACERGEEGNPRLFAILALMDERRPCSCGSECEACDEGYLPADDPYDEANWPKSNPSIGITPTWEYMRDQAKRAKNEPAFENAFLRFHCNVSVTSKMRLFNMERWASCQGKLPDWSTAEAICGAWDLGFRDDLAGIVIAGRFPGKDDKPLYAFWAHAWIPDSAQRNVNAEPWYSWRQDGWLTVTHGEAVDFLNIQQRIIRESERTGCAQWRFDRWNSNQLAQELQERRGLVCAEFHQNPSRYNEPTRDLMRAVGECEIVHDGNPVLAWCLGNAVARQNEREELAPDKKRSHEKIDLACCAIMAYSGVMLGFDEQPPGPADYYESNPVEFV